MANIHILADPASDAGAFSGGSWLGTLPLANLKTTQVTQVARSTGLGASATAFVVDMLYLRPLSMFALIASNLTNAATVRIRVSEAADGSNPGLDVTIPAFRPNVAWGAMPWGAFPWDGFRPDYQPGGATTFYKHPATVFGRYVLVDVADAANPAGYVQIGRFMAGDAFVPRFNFAPNAGLRFIDESRSSRSVGGQLFWDPKPKRRRFACQFPFASEAEAWGVAYDLQSRLGLTGSLLVVYDPGDADGVVLRRTIYGSLAGLDDIVTASVAIDYPYSWNLAVEELV